MEPYLVLKKGDRIEKLKEKYDIDEMDISNYNKLFKLDCSRYVFKTCVIVSGIIFVVDLIIPDPVFLIDEVALGTITSTFKIIDSIIVKKIKELIEKNKVEISYNELKDITINTGKIVKTIKKR